MIDLPSNGYALYSFRTSSVMASISGQFYVEQFFSKRTGEITLIGLNGQQFDISKAQAKQLIEEKKLLSLKLAELLSEINKDDGVDKKAEDVTYSASMSYILILISCRGTQTKPLSLILLLFAILYSITINCRLNRWFLCQGYAKNYRKVYESSRIFTVKSSQKVVNLEFQFLEDLILVCDTQNGTYIQYPYSVAGGTIILEDLQVQDDTDYLGTEAIPY